MTDTTDWADEIAAMLLFHHDEGEVKHGDVATALRKARAYGLREAAGMVFAAPGSDKYTTERFIREYADKLEKGEP